MKEYYRQCYERNKNEKKRDQEKNERNKYRKYEDKDQKAGYCKKYKRAA